MSLFKEKQPKPQSRSKRIKHYKLSVSFADESFPLYTEWALEAELLRMLHGGLFLEVKNFKLEEVPE